MEQPERLFIGCYPCGYVFGDKDTEEFSDYADLAFINYAKLELKFSNREIPQDCKEYIEWFHSTLKPGTVVRITISQDTMLGIDLLTNGQIEQAYKEHWAKEKALKNQTNQYT